MTSSKPLKLYDRHLSLDYSVELINVIVGARRTGKSYFILKEIDKNDDADCLYINLESDEFVDYDVKSLSEFIDKNIIGKKYLFIDEIQNIKNWEKLIRKLYELKRYFITLTGSSSKMLSSDISTVLRGRSVNYHMYPFSYFEIASQAIMSYEKYFNNGGLIQLLNINNTSAYVIDYKKQVVYKDVLERFNLKNLELLHYLIDYVCENSGAPISYRNIALAADSAGLGTSLDTVIEYVRYLKDAGFVSEVEFYSRSIKKRLVNNKRLYPLDHRFTKNGLGAKFETMTYNNLLSSGLTISHYLTNYEIDFVVAINDMTIPIQACYNISDDKTKTREISSILKFWDEYHYLDSAYGLVITNGYEGIEHFGKKKIIFATFDDVFKNGFESFIKRLTI
ncbi:MAG TPA: ATP-binding protein [Candidatus Saccharimonadales bacterium]|nr:ATP-binding protein [Candidatus Saccharimonadales bacterium]